jgi:hypothetical protein
MRKDADVFHRILDFEKANGATINSFSPAIKSVLHKVLF